MAKMHIETLGPIKNLNIDIGQFNLLIGEQATGKSTICKAVYFFREMKNDFIDFYYNNVIDGIAEKDSQKELCRRMEYTFRQIFKSSLSTSSKYELEYFYQEGISIKISSKQTTVYGIKHFDVQYSSKMSTEMKNIEELTRKYHMSLKEQDEFSDFVKKERMRIYKKIVDKITNLLGDDMSTYYIPAGRSVLSLISQQKTRLNYDTMDLINRKFLQYIEEIQPFFCEGIREVHRQIGNGIYNFNVPMMIEQIIGNLQGEYVYSDGSEYLKLTENQEKIPVSAVSSGQQEELWLLNELYVLLLSGEKAFIIIEEPEAHIYPLLQRDLLEFIVQVMNLTGSTVLITTHSPYILTASNVLFRGGKLIERAPDSETDIADILGEKKYILPSKIQAYKLIRKFGETSVESLIDEEEEEMRTELIDEVSKEISRKYTELFYFEENYETADTENG